jgi:hypothetical protein
MAWRRLMAEEPQPKGRIAFKPFFMHPERKSAYSGTQNTVARQIFLVGLDYTGYKATLRQLCGQRSVAVTD